MDLGVSAELGLGINDLQVSEASFRRAAGIRDDVEALTWRDLTRRRDVMADRLLPSGSGIRNHVFNHEADQEKSN